MAKMRKYQIIMFAYFPDGMHPEDIEELADGRFGKCQGNDITSMKDLGAVERKCS